MKNARNQRLRTHQRKLHAIPNQRHKGSLFEKISKQFLQEHDSAN
ncbi:hypothetical protein HPHPP26_1336, partial [Helicobacter pylori Hp P-26]